MACSGSVRAWKTRSRGAAIEIWQVTASLSELICEVGVMLSVAMRHRFLSLWYAGAFTSRRSWGLFFCRSGKQQVPRLRVVRFANDCSARDDSLFHFLFCWFP